MRMLNDRMIETGRHQRGAVAVTVGITIIVLVGMLGLVLDIGHLYVAKTELQNAADAAALSGAKQLNGTLNGVCCGSNSAQSRAIEAAGKNNYDLNGIPVTITAANLWVGDCPDDGCMVPISTVTSDASASNKTFLKVDTSLQTFNTWFIHVLPGATSIMQTFGMAVAGRFAVNLTPLGVCAIDPDTKGGIRTVNGTNELTEFGFRRGVAYNIPALNPLGAPRDPLFINPVAIPGGAVACQGNQGSANFTAPFVCAGSTAAIPAGLPSSVYVNTGASVSLERALNSRFEAPVAGSGPSPCDVDAAPPDTNIKQYAYNVASGSGGPADWMEPDPIQQTISLDPVTIVPVDFPNLSPPFNQYGVLWSYSRAVRAVGASPNATAGAPYDPVDWSTLYPGGSASYPTAAAIPPFPAGTLPAPYNQASSSNYFQAPTILPPGKRTRRVLNLAIVDCRGYVGGAVCASTLPMVGIGKFFMQKEADLTGSVRRIEGEFAGLIDIVATSEIRLYR